MNHLPSNWNQYFDPSAFSTPSGAGSKPGGSSGLGSIPGVGNALFGGGNTWQPYIDANGNYVYANPAKKNPVPVSSVPGASLKPNKTYQDMASNISALMTLFPEFSSIIAGQAIPQAQAALAGAQATAPGYEALARQQELAQGATDTAALQQASQAGGLLDSEVAAQKKIDPEYYATRALTAQKLAEMLQGIGPTVSREVGQGLAQSNSMTGTMGGPSQLGTVSNALQYGRAGQDELTKAISAATSAMPALTSGMNAFTMTTGRSPSANATTGTSGLTNASALGSNMAGNLANAQQANNLNATNIQLNSKDWADYLGQVTSSVGNLTSSASNIAKMCWIARRVYGENNSRWKMFRDYLLNEAPDNLREYYLQFGEQIANKLIDSQSSLIKTLMDKILMEPTYV